MYRPEWFPFSQGRKHSVSRTTALLSSSSATEEIVDDLPEFSRSLEEQPSDDEPVAIEVQFRIGASPFNVFVFVH